MEEENEDSIVLIDSERESIEKAPKRYSENWADKKVKWKDEEVITLFELIKKHNLLDDRPTDIHLGRTLADPMNNLGFKRTPHQIRLKIKGLRRNYVKCIKAGCTEETLKECPFFDLLHSVYGGRNLIAEDTFVKELHSDDENNDVEDVWSKEELETMLSLITEMKLTPEITLRSFSANALQKISEALGKSGYNRSPAEVKTALQSLKTTFIKFKRNYQRGQSTTDCPYFRYLKKMWGEEYVLTPKKPRISNQINDTEIWTEEETVMLLTSIKEMDIIDEAFQNTDYAAEKLVTILNDSGYTRTKQQIQSKMENLMQNYIKGRRLGDEKEVLRMFPFFFIYEKIFGSHFDNFDFQSFGQIESDDDHQTRKIVRGPIWMDKEIKTLLGLILELNLAQAFRERLTMKVLEKLEKAMKDREYFRTALQIKIKMKTLRKHYMRCIEDGCTPKGLAKCPFYNELNAIYKRSKVVYVPPPSITVRPRGEDFTETKLEAPEHGYVHSGRKKMIKENKNTSSRERSILLKNLPKDDKNTWTPIETIIELNGIKEDNEVEGERREEGKMEEEREVDDQDLEFEEVKTQEEPEFEEIKEVQAKEEQDEVVGVVVEEEVNYAENNDDFEELSNFDDVEFDPDFEEVTDDHSSFEELSNHSIKSLEDTKNNLIMEYLTLEEIIPKQKKLRSKSPARTFEKSPGKINEKSQIKAHEKSKMNINEKPQTRSFEKPTMKAPEKLKIKNPKKSPLKAPEKSSVKATEKFSVKTLEKYPIKAHEKISIKDIGKLPLKRKSVEIVRQLSSRKRKISDIDPNEESSEVDSMSTLMSSVMEHEVKMQKQHQEWLEQQFKIQRDHDREQRNVLLKELKEFRQAITSVMNQEVKTKKR